MYRMRIKEQNITLFVSVSKCWAVFLYLLSIKMVPHFN